MFILVRPGSCMHGFVTSSGQIIALSWFCCFIVVLSLKMTSDLLFGVLLVPFKLRWPATLCLSNALLISVELKLPLLLVILQV